MLISRYSHLTSSLNGEERSVGDIGALAKAQGVYGQQDKIRLEFFLIFFLGFPFTYSQYQQGGRQGCSSCKYREQWGRCQQHGH